MKSKHNITSRSDEQLMEMIEKGNEAAFTELYQRYAGKLLALIRRQLGYDTIARDLLHDIFLQLIEQPEQFNAKQRFSPWIYSVTVNRCRNERRNAQNRHKLLKAALTSDEEEIMTPAIVRQFRQQEFRKAYEQVYQRLHEEKQLLLTLRFNQGLPVKEISQVMDIPEGTVKSRLYYLMKLMADKLKIHHPTK